MARITEDLLRKCAEHNECEIFSLEELSLHQRNIVKIEHLDRWCRDLKILYLHNNLVSQIENLSRLKKLEYVNLTLNNITKIENLEGCESLKKLDLTVNFVGELTSIECLRGNSHLEELFLTGNPCADYEGYREFVLATLPQLRSLDGEKIKASERITAMQKFHTIRRDILEQQQCYMRKIGKSNEEIGDSRIEEIANPSDVEGSDSQNSFWKQPTSHTPQSRLEIYKHMEETRYKDRKNEEMKKPKPPRMLFTADGRPLNINEPKLNFELTEDEENNCFKLDLAVYRYLSTSLLEADVEPDYVRVRVKGKVFQLHLPKEVEDVLKSKSGVEKKKKDANIESKKEEKENKSRTLEVTSSIVEYLGNIVGQSVLKTDAEVKPTNEILEFCDNPEVPPLM